MKIRSKISLVVLTVAFISLSLLGLFSYREAQHQLIKTRGEQLTAIALNQKESINHLLTAWKDRSRLIANRTRLRELIVRYLQEPEEKHLDRIRSILMEIILTVPLVEGIVLCDLNGNKIIAAEERNSETSFCSTNVPYHVKSYRLSDIWMSENVPEKTSSLLVSIVGPIEYEQQSVSVIYTIINAAELIDIVDNYTAIGTTGETVLARHDEHGEIQFVTPLRYGPYLRQQHRIPADAARVPMVHALQGKRELFHFSYALDYIDYNDVPILAATDYIPELDWGIVVKINRDEVLQPIYDLRNTIVVYIVAIMLLKFFISSLIGHVISRPIAQLSLVAQKIRDGDLSLRAQVSSNDEIAHLATTFNQMLDALQELERKLKEKTVLAENRAARVRELASILTLAEQRERRHLAQILHDHLQQLLVAAKFGISNVPQKIVDPFIKAKVIEAGELLEESLNISRTLTVELSPPVLMDAGLAPALDWLARWMKEKHGLEVSIQMETPLNNPSEDRKIVIFQAVRELLFNVIKHAGTHQASIRMGPREQGELYIEVEDQGKGFDPKILNDANSTHFGLFNIRERLEFLGCRVNIESVQGKGSRCTIYAPAEEAPPSEVVVLKPSLPPAEKPDSSALAANLKIKILVVDDHSILRQCLITSLQDYPDIEIVGEAADGQQAVERAIELEPDVAIMDISMPRMNGVEATRKIKEARPEIKIIGLSLHEAEDMARPMIEAGANAYHCKTHPLDDLIHSIRDVSNF